MKKLINQPDAVVDEMLEGLMALDPGLARLSPHNVLVRADAAQVRDRQVALVSGGGSGHEPAHAGFVGQGMLSAAVAGDVFTSPSAESVFAAIKAVAGKPGVLLIVKNYTGDRLNFGLAAEMARAEGIAVNTVIVAEDVALKGRQEAAGARGLAGTVLVHKIAGAAAAEGKSLDEVTAAALEAAAAMGTMGISLSAGTSPAVGKPSFLLGEQEVELGLGIHGEPGIQRMPLLPADSTADTLIEHIAAAMGFGPGDRLAVLLNNLGSTTNMELAILARRLLHSLSERGFLVERIYSGTLLSSLDMAGVSLTLLRVDDARLRLLDAATSAPAWPNVPRRPPMLQEGRVWTSILPAAPDGPAHSPKTAAGKKAERAIRAACAALRAAEGELTEMDQLAGDGDLGVSLTRGAKAVEASLSTYDLDNLPSALKAIGHTLRSSLGGSSGPLYGVLFIRGASALEHSVSNGGEAGGLRQWAKAVQEACQAIHEMGGANPGDRTMLDALVPFSQTLADLAASGQNRNRALELAVNAAQKGAEETAKMLPRRGRSSYLGKRVLGHPDPGAVAVSVWLQAVASSFGD